MALSLIQDVRYKDPIVIDKGFYSGQTGIVTQKYSDATRGTNFQVTLSDGKELVVSNLDMSAAP